MNLKEARFKKNMAQDHLAYLVGIHQSYLSKIERGYAVPDDDIKKKIAEKLSIENSQIEYGKIEE